MGHNATWLQGVRGLGVGKVWQRLKEGRVGNLAAACRRSARRMAVALQIPPPEAPEWLRRITIMERNIILPIKTVGLVVLFYLFYFRPWMINVSDALGVELEATRYFFWFYIGINVAVAGLVLMMRRLPLALVQWLVFAMGLVDGIFLSTLALVTGGYNSIVYWLFLGLIVRSAISIPPSTIRPSSAISTTPPTKPNSSPIVVKMKSVCFSGRKSRCPWVPCR